MIPSITYSLVMLLSSISEQPQGPPTIREAEPPYCHTTGNQLVVLRGANFLPDPRVEIHSIVDNKTRKVEAKLVNTMTTVQYLIIDRN